MRPGGLKRWSTDRRGWWRLQRAATRVVRHEDLVLVHLEAMEVVEPLWVTCAGERVKILDDGYAWLFICREGARHVVTAHCDALGRPVHWYVDIVDRWVIGADGFPVYEDLFLDVVATPSRGVELRDADELEEALERGLVTTEQYAMAHGEAEHAMAAIRDGSFEPVSQTAEFLALARRGRGRSA